MPSDTQKPLVALAAFKGIDTTTVGPRVEEGRAASATNADPSRTPGAFTTAQGRVNLTTLSGGGTINALMQFDAIDTLRLVVASVLGSATTGIETYPVDGGTQYAVSNSDSFNQAVSFEGVVYTSAGQQLQVTDNGTIGPNRRTFENAVAWQHAPADIGVTTFTAAVVSGGPMAQQAYSYAYTLLVVEPNGTTQETTAIGNNVPTASLTYPYTVTVSSSSQSPQVSDLVNSIANQWSWTFFDGTTWNIRIYRQSAGQPVWYLVASGYSPDCGSGDSFVYGTTVIQLGNGVPYTDALADGSITGNLQLQLGGDPPPTNSEQQAVIFSHKDRMWTLALVTDTATNGFTQCQLWYSGYGLGWYFDAVNGALLVGSEDLPVVTGYTGYGDIPVAGMSLSSVGVLWKSYTMWILYGDDPTTFVVRKVADMGLIAPRSAAECQGVVYGLYDEGVYAFDGATIPLYVGERLRGFLDTLTPAQKASAVGWFSARSYWLSFPGVNVTYRYHLPTQEWIGPLPYATSAAYAIPAQALPAIPGALAKNDFVVAAEPNSTAIDLWGAAETDLGATTASATWTAALTDSGSPQIEKAYNMLALNAPVQPGAKAIVTLLADPGVVPIKQAGPYTVDLSKGTTAVWTVGRNDGEGPLTGFLAQLSVEITGPATSAPVTVWSCSVYGDAQRNLVVVDNGAVTS